MSDVSIDTGDAVLHRPSGEKWLVAFVDDEHLYWCGWPEGRALLSDCELVRKATPDARLKLLRDMRTAQGVRGRYAARMLESEGAA